MAFNRNEKITILAALISSPIITFVIDWTKSVPVTTTLINIVRRFWDLLISIFTYELQVWVVLLLILGLFIAIAVYGTVTTRKSPGFNYLTHTGDNIIGYRWSWNYTWRDDIKKHQIVDFKAYCPKCDSGLRFKDEFLSPHTECIRCDFRMNENIYGDLHRIESLIIDNIERFSRQQIQNTTR